MLYREIAYSVCKSCDCARSLWVSGRPPSCAKPWGLPGHLKKRPYMWSSSSFIILSTFVLMKRIYFISKRRKRYWSRVFKVVRSYQNHFAITIYRVTCLPRWGSSVSLVFRLERPYLMTGLKLMYFWLMKSIESTVNLWISLKSADSRPESVDFDETGRFNVDSKQKSTDFIRIRRFQWNLQSFLRLQLENIVTNDNLPGKVTPIFFRSWCTTFFSGIRAHRFQCVVCQLIFHGYYFNCNKADFHSTILWTRNHTLFGYPRFVLFFQWNRIALKVKK